MCAFERKPIPPQAKMVFKGVLFNTWQWEQEMFDGSTETFEMLERANTAAVLASVGDKVLIQIEEQPDTGRFVSVPGGRCEAGESGEESARRELLEETGYTSDNFELLKEIKPFGKIYWTIYIYVARGCTKIQEPRPDAGERIESTLVSFEDFLLLPDNPEFRAWELNEVLLRARLDEGVRNDLKMRLFGSA